MCVTWHTDMRRGAEPTSVMQRRLPESQGDASVRSILTPRGLSTTSALEPRSELWRLGGFYEEGSDIVDGPGSCDERLARLVSLYHASVFALLGELSSAQEASEAGYFEQRRLGRAPSSGGSFDSE